MCSYLNLDRLIFYLNAETKHMQHLGDTMNRAFDKWCYNKVININYVGSVKLMNEQYLFVQGSDLYNVKSLLLLIENLYYSHVQAFSPNIFIFGGIKFIAFIPHSPVIFPIFREMSHWKPGKYMWYRWIAFDEVLSPGCLKFRLNYSCWAGCHCKSEHLAITPWYSILSASSGLLPNTWPSYEIRAFGHQLTPCQPPVLIPSAVALAFLPSPPALACFSFHYATSKSEITSSDLRLYDSDFLPWKRKQCPAKKASTAKAPYQEGANATGGSLPPITPPLRESEIRGLSAGWILAPVTAFFVPPGGCNASGHFSSQHALACTSTAAPPSQRSTYTWFTPDRAQL